MRNIVLIGIMGCGKTTIAALLAKKLKRPVIDIDEYIVEKHQQTIPEMFKIGETYFRENETDGCKDMAKLEGHIISTGGGVVLNPLNIQYLKENGVIVYIDRSIDDICKDVETSTRPLLKDGPQKLYDLNKQRYQLYLDACDIHFINDDTLENVTNNLIEILKNYI
ncbi:shikimate kinase [Thomasclavelia saccharogumia]|uniref:shikimate kinase n=1 Tax=Thomasclavelia saccharogumia TaxID=341225 RepID=UPI00047B91DA|nr:shikimate kinase [Thomasclavelia saccharogumia]